jgi:GNAT superfamily N-acetyltransferase
MAKPPPISIEFPLRDGTLVVIRPILPSDADRLRDGFERLSPESRYRRFMSAVDELSDEQVRFLTHVDYEDHMAWVALDPLDPGRRGLGVARYVRVAEEPSVAEAAVTVVDSHQGRGLGTVLLGVLALSAERNGIRTFRGFVLEANAPMLASSETWEPERSTRGAPSGSTCRCPTTPRTCRTPPRDGSSARWPPVCSTPFVTRPQGGGRGVGRMA